MKNRYIPRPCIADVSTSGLARARATFSGGILIYDAADPHQVLAVVKADERGFYDHAERLRLALQQPAYIFEEMDAGSVAVFRRLTGHLNPGYDLLKVPQDRLWDAWRPSAALAEGEGWGIFDSGNYGLEIEADAESTIFVRDGTAFDDEAVEFVRTKAMAGSFYHSVAIAIHDLGAVERKAKCEAAGYKASCGIGGDWSVMTPEGKIVVVAAQTEEAAWAYAYRHLGEHGEG